MSLFKRNTPPTATQTPAASAASGASAAPAAPVASVTPRPISPAFTLPERLDDPTPHASYALYAPQGHFSANDQARMRRLMMNRLIYRADLYTDDDDPTTGAPCADRLALHFASDLRDFWMGASEVWPSGARLFDDRHAPYADVVDAARDAITAWSLNATLFDDSATSVEDDPSESDIDEVDLIGWRFAQFA